jgi:aminopeptidase N
MPLNDYPTAKPSYDFSDTVTAGRTVVANGELISVQHHGSGTDFWTTAPSNPIPYSLFDTSNTYNRPGAAYIALRQIIGPARFDAALRQLQRTYGGSSITEPELEAVFQQWLPVHSSACQQRLSQFFRQWFDTAYPAGGGANRPTITGPGLAGSGFYGADGTCT